MDFLFFLNKRILILTMFSIFLVGYIYLYIEYSNARNRINKEYTKYKEMSFLLKNFKSDKIQEIDEVILNKLFKGKGVEVKSISKVEDTFLIHLKEVDMVRLTDIIYSIEKLGVEIVQMEAIDNTGKGRYEVKIKLR